MLDLMEKEEKQAAFPALLYNRQGDVTRTCYDLGISRAVWRKWVEESEEFAQMCADVTESLIDLGVSALITNVKQGKSSDIQFLLKTLGKHRGFGERVEVEHTGLVRHAHAHAHYPPEPTSVADWERQMIEAESVSPESEPASEPIAELPITTA